MLVVRTIIITNSIPFPLAAFTIQIIFVLTANFVSPIITKSIITIITAITFVILIIIVFPFFQKISQDCRHILFQKIAAFAECHLQNYL